MRRALARVTLRAQESVMALEERMLLATPAREIGALQGRLGEIQPRLEASLRHRLSIARERLLRGSASLSSLSPLAVLERGYAVVWKEGVQADAAPLRSAADVASGDRLRIRLARGELFTRVESRKSDRDES
jgi:exodeoxyribonuclease VII large subunit